MLPKQFILIDGEKNVQSRKTYFSLKTTQYLSKEND